MLTMLKFMLYNCSCLVDLGSLLPWDFFSFFPSSPLPPPPPPPLCFSLSLLSSSFPVFSSPFIPFHPHFYQISALSKCFSSPFPPLFSSINVIDINFQNDQRSSSLKHVPVQKKRRLLFPLKSIVLFSSKTLV